MSLVFNNRNEYQKECVNTLNKIIQGSNRALVVLPTSSGKTHIFCRFIESNINNSFLIIVPKVDLVIQTKERLKEIVGIEAAIFCPSINKKQVGNITISTMQSALKIDYKFDFILFDECHRQTKRIESIEFNKTWLGFTATPFRNNSSIIGDFYKKIDYQIPISTMIKSGFITPYILQAPDDHFQMDNIGDNSRDYTANELEGILKDTDKIKKQIDDLLKRTKYHQKVAVMCVNINHAEFVSSLLKSSVCIHSKKSFNDNEDLLKMYKNEDIKFLVSVTKLSEGFDYDKIDCIALMRPTRSVSLMIQMIGRGLRLSKDKAYCQILDYGEVIKYCGTPENPILQGQQGTNKKICKRCKTINLMKALSCCFCGNVFKSGESRNYDYLSKLTVEPAKKDNSEVLKPLSLTVDWGYKTKSGMIVPKVTIRDELKIYFVWLFGNRTNEVSSLLGYNIEEDKIKKLKKFYIPKSDKKVKLIKNGNYYDFRVI